MEDYDKGYDEGYDMGYDAGYSEGYGDALGSMEKELVSVSDELLERLCVRNGSRFGDVTYAILERSSSFRRGFMECLDRIAEGVCDIADPLDQGARIESVLMRSYANCAKFFFKKMDERMADADCKEDKVGDM